MKRILILISSLGGGGAEHVAARLAGMFSQKYEVYLLPFSKAAVPYEVPENVRILPYALFDLRSEKGRLRRLLMKGLSGLVIYARLGLFRLREKPDVTLSLLLLPNLMNILAPGKCRKFISERNNPKRKGFLEYHGARLVSRFADTVIFQSERIRQFYPKAAQGKGVIVPNPVETAAVAAKPAMKIVNAGRLRPQKNQEMLIRAFAAFRKTHPSYTLHIYGDGPLREHLLAVIRETGTEDSAFLHPFTADLHAKMADAAFFVLSSDFEGMPNILLEAMMMGIPCISSTYPGSEELLKNEENALMFPAGDARALEEAMARLAEDPALRQSLIKNARSMTEAFRPDRVYALWEEAVFGKRQA